MGFQRAKSSDQLPEEAPEGQVPDEVPGSREGAARETGRRHARETQLEGFERDTLPSREEDLDAAIQAVEEAYKAWRDRRGRSARAPRPAGSLSAASATGPVPWDAGHASFERRLIDVLRERSQEAISR